MPMSNDRQLRTTSWTNAFNNFRYEPLTEFPLVDVSYCTRTFLREHAQKWVSSFSPNCTRAHIVSFLLTRSFIPTITELGKGSPPLHCRLWRLRFGGYSRWRIESGCHGSRRGLFGIHWSFGRFPSCQWGAVEAIQRRKNAKRRRD